MSRVTFGALVRERIEFVQTLVAGVTIFEIVTCEIPYADLNPQQALVELLSKHVTLTLPKHNFHPIIQKLFDECLSWEPNDRPDFNQICEQLEDIHVK